MIEEKARSAVASIAGPAGMALLERFTELVRVESERQNLVSRSTIDTIWSRHILDSAQLLRFDTAERGVWLDVGSGAGFPGLVVALLGRHGVVLTEPRRGRAAFLQHCVDALGIGDRVRVIGQKVQHVRNIRPAVISARAVSAIGALFDASRAITIATTRFVLPRGSGACDEVDYARRSWHGVFHVEHSLTNPESGIVIADRVSPR